MTQSGEATSSSPSPKTPPYGDVDIASPFRFQGWRQDQCAPKNEVDTKIALLPLR